MAVPASNVVIFNTHYGSDPYGSVRSSINYNFPAIGKFTMGSRGTGRFSKVYKQWLIASATEQLAHSDGNPLVIRKWAFQKMDDLLLLLLPPAR